MVTRAGDSNNGAPTGVAISLHEICAVDARIRGSSDRTWRAPLEPPAPEGGWPSLAGALSDLARTLGVTEGVLSISLLPPLTEVRQIELPPLAEADLQRVLSRDAGRYFVNARTPQVIGASFSAKRSRKGPSAVVAVAAAARLVASIRAAASVAGWTIEEIGPAETAWVGAAVSMWPAFAKQNAYAVIAHDDRTDLLQIDSGRLSGVRRFRAGAVDAPMIADVVGPSARLGAAGASGPRKAIIAALSSLRVTVATPTGEHASGTDDSDVLAAQFAGSDAGPLLRTEAAVAGQTARARRMMWSILGAAAALLVAAAVVELVGVHHQLDVVRAERAAIKPQLSATLVGRTTVTGTYTQLTALDSIERNAPQWAVIIGTLGDAVPDGAHLTAIRARDDSLIVDGLALRAKPVFDALESTQGLLDVRASSPVRRELQDDGQALEHFTIAARVARPSRTTVTPALATKPGAAR
ncbi:MAG: PilN domain-containing protein [Gemmatimonadaceae bacterium]